METTYQDKTELIKSLCAMERSTPTTTIRVPSDIVPPLLKRGYHNKRQEHFVAITLSGSHSIIKIHTISKGLVNRTIVHPREILYHAIKDNAAAIMVAHNHPSGSIVPSREDQDVTQRIKSASEIMGFRLLDHVIIAKGGGYYSFLEGGEL